jgi:hypothetical protein
LTPITVLLLSGGRVSLAEVRDDTPRTLRIRRRISGEEPIAEALSTRETRRAGEEGASRVLDVLVERVGRSELLLERDELARALHEDDEEEAAKESASLGIDAVRERVAAPENPQAAVLLVARQPDVGVGRDYGCAIAFLLEPGRSELVAAGQRRSPFFEPAEDGLLVGEIVAIPVLDGEGPAGRRAGL